MQAALDATPQEGWFPLVVTVDAGDGEAVVRLLEAGDDANQAVAAPSEHPTLPDWDWVGMTPLLLAARKGNLPVVEVLLAHEGIEVDKAHEDGATPVFMAAMKGHHGIVRVLADKGANLDLADKFGRTPVWMAAMKGHHGIVRMLAEDRANLDLIHRLTWTTPVFMAAMKGRHEVVRVLADKGANLDLADKDGRTPLSIAAQNGHDEVVSFLSTWRQYLRHQHCLIRLRVGATYATFPVGHEERVLHHFAYGQNKVGAPVAAEDVMLPTNLLPDDLWPLVVRCLVGDGNGTAQL